MVPKPQWYNKTVGSSFEEIKYDSFHTGTTSHRTIEHVVSQFTQGAIQYKWKALLDKSDLELTSFEHAVE